MDCAPLADVREVCVHDKVAYAPNVISGFTLQLKAHAFPDGRACAISTDEIFRPNGASLCCAICEIIFVLDQNGELSIIIRGIPEETVRPSDSVIAGVQMEVFLQDPLNATLVNRHFEREASWHVDIRCKVGALYAS